MTHRPSRLPRVRRLAGALTLAAIAAACGRRGDATPLEERDSAFDGAAAAARPAPSAQPAQPSTPAGSEDPEQQRTLQRADAARIQGRESAPLWVVEISDFQCPYCKRWHDETYPVLRREYVETGKVRFAYLNLPLPSHRHAIEAAEAALCAGLQGKYWEMHDALFDTQQRWSSLESASAVFDSLAGAVTGDSRQVRACVNDHRTRPLVAADYERAVQSGIRSTPTFIIGGQLVEGAIPTAAFRRVVDSLLAATPRRGR